MGMTPPGPPSHVASKNMATWRLEEPGSAHLSVKSARVAIKS